MNSVLRLYATRGMTDSKSDAQRLRLLYVIRRRTDSKQKQVSFSWGHFLSPTPTHVQESHFGTRKTGFNGARFEDVLDGPLGGDRAGMPFAVVGPLECAKEGEQR